MRKGTVDEVRVGMFVDEIVDDIPKGKPYKVTKTETHPHKVHLNSGCFDSGTPIYMEWR